MVYHRILNVVLCAIVVGILVTKSCPALCNPMDYSPPGSSVHRILHARILEWVTLPSSTESSWPRDWTRRICLLQWQVGSLPLVLPRKPLKLIRCCQIVFQSSQANLHSYRQCMYSCLENPMDAGAWWAAVHGVAKSWTWLERLHFHSSLSRIGEGNGNPLQYSCLENPRHGGAWRTAVYGVAQSRTRLKRLSSSSNSRQCMNVLINPFSCQYLVFSLFCFSHFYGCS